jgi:hypothetical protein
MRYAFKAVDFGASIVFMSMCAKAFWHHFYKDIEQQVQRPKNSPSLVPAKVVKFGRPPIGTPF